MPFDVNRVAAGYEKRIADSLTKAFAAIRSKVKVKELENILSTYGVESAYLYIQQLNISGIIDNHIVDDLNEAIIKSGRMSFSVVPPGAVLDTTFRFNLLAYNASQFVRGYQFALIKDISQASITAIRQSLFTDITAGVNPISTARNFRSAIGLTARQEQAVRNFEGMLREGDRELLTRALRDKRFDSTIRRSIKDGVPLSNKQINAMTKRYRERYLKYRAETIARTESLRAVSMGQHLSMMQAIEGGNINGDELTRHWIYTHDVRTRHAHKSVNILNPEGVRVDQPFQTELGPLMYPRDPNGSGANTINCRCSVRYKMVGEEDEAPEWTNAKNLKELDEKMGNMDLGNIYHQGHEYSKAAQLKMGNMIGKHADEVLKNNPGIKTALGKQALFGTNIIKGKNLASIGHSDAAGIYNGSSLEMSVAGSLLKKDTLGRFGGGLYSLSKDVFSVWRHELGHHIWNRLPLEHRERFRGFFSSKGKNYFKVNVTRYSATRVEEGFCESLSGYTSPLYGTGPGKSFPKELADLMGLITGG